MPFGNFTNVSTYTRADALADGVLIDISSTAQTYGFKLPFAISDVLYRGYRNRQQDWKWRGRAWRAACMIF